ncbi:MAG: fibronectin-binding domain-containing protein [Bacillati bacterium ANGP1]|uniref:Rqc2 homolog RqcH n=1 Tax=Candidatus Segetimicrobium genomatis TaxID=2569760 RepID=A0A537IM65_9BACT|nr:MAG: fibronectin-binding domain-containing protein [Terrabacteria group bacterium ANGP1]
MARLLTSFDSVVLAAVAREVAALVGSRAVRVAQPAPDEIAIDLRAPSGSATVLCSIHPRWARIHLASKTASGGPSSFAQVLRSRLESATLAGVRQTSFERILTLTFRTVRDRADLIVEIMGRHSNLILVEDGTITGSLKSVPREKSSVREVLPGRPYVAPPADRPSPASLDEQSLAAMLSSSDEPLAKRLVASVLGLSPPLAAEIVVRAGLNPEAPSRGQAGAAARLWETLQEVVAIVARDAFAPVLYYDGSAPVGFAPFPFKSLAGLRSAPTSSMSEAVEMVLGQFGAAARIEEERAALLAAIRAALERVERTAAEVQRAVEEAERTGKLRQHGELLLAYASQIPPRVPHVTLPGFDGAPVTIDLDPTLSAVENAQRLFKRYGRVRSARPALEARLRAAADERAYLESARALIEQALSSDDLFDLRRELADEGYVRARKTPARPSATPGPRRFVLADGTTTVLVGRTNHENDVLTFKVASPDDIWLHARGTPGAHAILKSGAANPSEETIQQAAAIAAYFSKARGAAQTAVDYTRRRYVRKPRGAKPGLVTYARERTVYVKPELPGPREQGNPHAGPAGSGRSGGTR